MSNDAGLESQQQEQATFETNYFENVAKAKNLILERTEQRVATINLNTLEQHNHSNISQNNLKLPSISLPTFDGSYENWHLFRDTFYTLVHTNTSIGKIQKFYYLRMYLSKNASQVIDALEVSEVNYQIAWDLLVKRYDNKRLTVHSHVQALFNLPTLYKESYSALRELFDKLLKHIRALKNLDQPTESWDTLIIHLTISKLDPITKREWETSVSNKTNELPTFKEFEEFLTKRCQLLETLNPQSSQAKLNVKPKITALVATNVQECTYCNDSSHGIYSCDKFIKLNIDARTQITKQKQLCINCLRKGHFVYQCRSKSRCRHCHRKHNSLLHIETTKSMNGTGLQNRQEGNAQSSQPNALTSANKSPQGGSNKVVGSSLVVESVQSSFSSEETSVNCQVSNKIESNNVLLSTASAYVKDNNGKWQLARLLLDSGSQANFITHEFQKQLGLPVTNINSKILGINQATVEINQQTTIELKSRVNSFTTKISCLTIPKITGKLPSGSFNSALLNIPENITLSDPNFNTTGPINLLLGAAIFWQLLCTGQIILSKGGPVLQKTILGWVVSGPLPIKTSNNLHCGLSQHLERKLEEFWEIDDNREKRELNKEEQACELYFKETTRRDNTGRFIVAIPFKENKANLGNSREMALKRLYSLERRLTQNLDQKGEYVTFLEEYERLGHMIQIDESKEVKQHQIVAYLPHHAVTKNSSSTTKVRVVFDASAKTDSGLSLNDIQNVGPVVQSELFTILLRFRKHKYVLIADIEKMYRQILIAEDDRASQRILWRENDADKIKCFELQTVTYGTASAPYLATRCLQQLSLDFKTIYPRACEVIHDDFYVDDMLTGAATISELKQLQYEIDSILRSAGLILRKWLSNESQVINKTNIESYNCDLDHKSDTKVLGVYWNANSDTFTYTSKTVSTYKHVTKRTILSVSAQLFDPLGLLTPITINAKLIMQLLWHYQLAWDEAVPNDIATKWLVFQDDIKYVENLEIPRYVLRSDASNVQLHGFADASEKAYGACVYICCMDDSENDISVRLICAKSRVASLRKTSIPRLELCAAVLLADLMQRVAEAMKINFDRIYYWTDSMIVLSWIQAPSSRWQTFVANRVASIQRQSDVKNWYHVKSHDNPADLISRGVTAQQISRSELWWYGPSWLTKKPTSWPLQFELEEIELPEEKRVKTCLANLETDRFELLEKFSSLVKVVRVTAWMCRFIQNTKLPEKRGNGPLTVLELDQALIKLIRIAQKQYFQKEITELKGHKTINSKSRILALNPFVDQDNILRVGGRIKQSWYHYEKKHPIILPPKHCLTKLIIKNEHLRNLHCGPQTLLAIIREKYWPITGRNLVKQIFKNCIVCFKVNPKPSIPLMGDLPVQRVTPAPVFHHCSIDYAGLYLLKDKRGRGNKSIKAYISIFVCLVTKCVHIELEGNLTTEAFLACLRRFISRRGKPLNFYSDNATNFVGARAEIQEFYGFLNNTQVQEELIDTLAMDGISWHFIPPRSPHFGGIWEAGIKSIKSHLKRVIGNASLVFEDFYTILTQVEAILNSRPLYPLSSDPDDLNPLTPGHFLIGRPLVALPDPDLKGLPENRLSQFQRIQQLTQHIWSRWSREYIAQLQTRTKWKTNSSTLLKEGALVIVKEDNQPPLKWQLGRVQRVILGKDNIARVVEIKTSSAIIKRAVHKICVLPNDDNY